MGVKIVAGGSDGQRAFGSRMGKRVAERCVGVNEGSAREMQAHDFHHHLVGISGAVEGAGAGAVIGF